METTIPCVQSRTAGDDAPPIYHKTSFKRLIRSVNQSLRLVATHTGSQQVSCTPKQTFYFPVKRTLTIKVVTSDESGGGGADTGSGPSPGLHKFDIVLIVLGCVGALLLIAVIIAVVIRFKTSQNSNKKFNNSHLF